MRVGCRHACQHVPGVGGAADDVVPADRHAGTMNLPLIAQHRPGVAVAALVATAMLAAACGGDSNNDTTDPATVRPGSTAPSTPRSTPRSTPPSTRPSIPPATTASAETTDPAPSTSAALESATIDTRIAFVVAAVNDPTTATDAALAEHFDPAFLAAVPGDQIRAVFSEASAAGAAPWSVGERAVDDVGGTVTLVAADGAAFTLTIEIEPNAPNRIVSALLQPGRTSDIVDAFDDPGSPAEIDAAIDAVAERSVYGVYDVTDDAACTALHERNAEIAAPTGSTFKLWVLVALAQAIERGEATWDETLTIRAEHRSSPDGEVYPRPDGTPVTLRELAELMISISDNTATDMLITYLGRPAIEQMIVDLGLAAADRNVPFLTTAELFRLKFVDPALGARYVALDTVDARRDFLDNEVAATPLPWIGDPSWVPGAAFTTPTMIDAIEWFATPRDVCITFVELDRLASTPGLEPVAEILAINPGLPFPDGAWSTIRFKGGSEPGVIMFGYWLEAPTGDRRVVMIGLSDTTRTITDIDGAVAAARLIGLAAADLG
jgi:hypothetical protein